MEEKVVNIKGLVQHKRKTEADWYKDVYDEGGNLRTNPFIPKNGQIIAFISEDNETGDKLKVGDGVRNVMDLPFSSSGSGGGGGGTSVLDSLLSLSGTKKKTLNMNNCSVDVEADYSIVGGTNDKTVISNILGSLASNSVSIAKPVINADCGISFGSGTVVNSTGGNAIGVWNTSGVKGYYWRKIVAGSTAGTYVITLSTKQDTDEWVLPNGVTFDWIARTTILGYVTYEGDTISIVNDSKHPACAKIIDTGTDPNTGTPTITVDSLPFSERASVSLKTPDDYTIYACYEKSEVTGVNSRWYPRSGAVELGWAGTAFGVENLVTGSGGFVGGWNNWQAGDFGAAFGRDNISGYACLTAGMNNKNKGLTSIIIGNNVQLKSNCINSAGFGKDHVLEHDAVFAAGSTHTIKTYAGMALGSSNLVDGYASAAIGLALETNRQSQIVVGQFNKASTMNANGTAQFVVGTGSSRDATANGLILYRDGRLEIGADPVNNKDVVTLGYFNTYKKDENLAGALIPVYTSNSTTTTGYNSIIIGEVTGHNITREYNLSIGQRNTIGGPRNLVSGSDNVVASGRHYTFTAGQSNTVNQSYATAIGRSNVIQTAGTFAIGLYNKTYNKTGQFVVGRGNKVEKEAMFIVGNNSAITGGTTIYTDEAVDAARSNAFVSWADGRATIGAAPKNDMDVVNLAYLKDYLLDKEW